MKNLYLLIVGFLVISNNLLAQVAINTDGSSPDNSAMLDIKSTTMGLLVPRLTQAQRDAILSPAAWLVIFQTDGTPGLYYNSGSTSLPVWTPVGSQWSTNGNKIFYNTGFVGIGVSNPASDLDIRGNNPDYGGVFMLGNSDLTHRIVLFGGRQNDPFPFINWKQGDPLRFTTDEGGWSEKMRITSDGKVGIGTTVPDNSALMELSSSSKGFLPPRMTFADRQAINNPADGLLVYCTNCGSTGSGAVSIYMNGQWYSLSVNCDLPLQPVGAANVPSYNQIIWNWNTVPIALGYKWNTVNNYSTAIDVGTGTSYTETGLSCWKTYTRYAWAYNSCGVSPADVLTGATSPILFTTPVAGIQIARTNSIVWNWNSVNGAKGYMWNRVNDYSTATNLGNTLTITESGLLCNTAYTRFVWAYDSCGYSTATALTETTNSSPSQPIALTSVPSTTQIIWQWGTLTNETISGSKWNTVNDYSTATDLGATLTTTETGLLCNTAYTRYVWLYNTCDHSTATALTQSTTACCATSITINHIAGQVAPVTKTVTYGIVTNIPGEPDKCWISQNLGADHQANTVDDATEASAGWYWQYSFKQGYKHDGTTRIPNTTWNSGFSLPYGWIAANDPCTIELGSNWRIPTMSEWVDINTAGVWTSWNGPWASALKMHAAGSLTSGYGTLSNRGAWGNYWSSGQYDINRGESFSFNSTYTLLTYTLDANGFSLRCLRQ